jgi:hypothetical protein
LAELPGDVLERLFARASVDLHQLELVQHVRLVVLKLL